MGAWIETGGGGESGGNPPVAPYVGAWIETRIAEHAWQGNEVAPYVGAWIETIVFSRSFFTESSRTLRGCVD